MLSVESKLRAASAKRWLQDRKPCTARTCRGRPRAAVKAPHELQLGLDIPITMKTVHVAGRPFQLVVPDIDAVMEMYLCAGQASRDPYWCDVWPSALLMAEELLSRPELVRGRTVCEVGCGLGLAGLAAAAAGAAEVVLLDREPLALQCALINAKLNGIPTSLAGGDASTAVPPATLHLLAEQLQESGAQQAATSTPQLPPPPAAPQNQQQRAAASPAASSPAQSEPAPLAASSSSGDGGGGSSSGGSSWPPGVVRAEVFDWSQPVQVERCEVALACDVLYETFSVEPVARVVPQLLRRDGGRLLLADPPDRARHNRECFLDMLCEESGEFVLEECAERRVRVWEEGKGEWRQVPVALMLLRRTYGSDTVGVKALRR